MSSDARVEEIHRSCDVSGYESEVYNTSKELLRGSKYQVKPAGHTVDPTPIYIQVTLNVFNNAIAA